jgi:hypothetical protein
VSEESAESAESAALAHGPYSEELANRALPLVRRIVDDLVKRYREWQDAVSRFEYATAKSMADAPDPEADGLQAEAERMAAEIDACVNELAELGVECRAFDIGLVIFPGERDGRPSRFVWRRGDVAVSEWRDYDAGSASANGTSSSMPSRAQPVAGNTSLASRSRSDGSRE